MDLLSHGHARCAGGDGQARRARRVAALDAEASNAPAAAPAAASNQGTAGTTADGAFVSTCLLFGGFARRGISKPRMFAAYYPRVAYPQANQGRPLKKGSPRPAFFSLLGVIFFRRHPQVSCH